MAFHGLPPTSDGLPPCRCGFHELFERTSSAQARQRPWARVVVDEPQELSAAQLARLSLLHAHFRWALCGTARLQLERCLAVAWGGAVPCWAGSSHAAHAQQRGRRRAARATQGAEEPAIGARDDARDDTLEADDFDNNFEDAAEAEGTAGMVFEVPAGMVELRAVSIAERLASRFVERRAVADPPGECLPMPPLRETLVPITLPLDAAMRANAYHTSGDLVQAVRIANGLEAQRPPPRAAPAEAVAPFGRSSGGDAGDGDGEPPSPSRHDGLLKPTRTPSAFDDAVEDVHTRALGVARAALDALQPRASQRHQEWLARFGLVCTCGGGGRGEGGCLEGGPPGSLPEHCYRCGGGVEPPDLQVMALPSLPAASDCVGALSDRFRSGPTCRRRRISSARSSAGSCRKPGSSTCAHASKSRPPRPC